MNTRRLLVFLPLALIALLLQSAFWVPTYGSQTKGTPKRLTTFIEAKIGDAKILNPLLSADNTSSQIYSRRIFETLIEADEKLELRPWLAEGWEVTEEAYLAAMPERTLADGSSGTGAGLLDALRTALTAGRLAELERSLVDLTLVPAEERPIAESVMRKGKNGKPEPYTITGRVALPERVRLRLRRVMPELFRHLEPVLGSRWFEGYPFETRFRLDKPSELPELRPKLPELFPIGEHNPIVSFRLRKDVRFHDGHPFTAKDVEFTYRAIIDPKNASPRASSFEPIKTVRVVDDHHLEVVYKRLYSPAVIDWAQMGIVPEHLLNAKAMQREMDRRKLSPAARATFSMRSADFNRAPIGTGPFRFVEWKADQFVHVKRNENYWGRRPEYEDLYTRVIPDYLTQELELRSGALDTYEPLPHQANRYRMDDRYQLAMQADGYYTYIAYNQRRPIFQDPRVRRALGMAINVDALIKYVLSGQGKRASGPFYSYTPYSDPETPLLPYDPKRAADLLREAGWIKNRDGWLQKAGKVLEFTLITNSGNPQRKATITIAQEAWRALGIRCVAQAFEWTVFLEQVNKLQFDALVLGWVGGDINPDKYELWHSSRTEPFQLNFTGYKSTRVDALLERIREEYDRPKQIQLARELHRLIASDQPYTFLYEPIRPHVLDKRIVLVDRDSNGRERYSKIEPSPSGEIDYYFDKWRKLASLPSLPSQ